MASTSHPAQPTAATGPLGRLAFGLAGASALILAGGLVLDPAIGEAWYLLPIVITFVAVGALVASRRPANPIGWLFLAFGVAASIGFSATAYAQHALVEDPGSLPGADVAAIVAAHLWHPSFGFFVFSFLLFPNGRLPSPGWRWVARATFVTYGGLAISGIFNGDLPLGEPFERAQPLFEGTIARVATVVFEALLSLNLLVLLISAVSLLVRLRHSTGEERQQIKWFVYPVACIMFFFPVSVLVLGDAGFGVLLFPLIPAAAGLAILKYRLYDIDVVINRTLVYGGLTTTLTVAYLGCVLLLEWALRPLTEQSDLAIAVSTLTVAALFGPARRRIQTAVDHRFYRRKYDAALTLEAFGARLRDEVDLASLSSVLNDAVHDTTQPTHVSLWLREPGGASKLVAGRPTA